MFESGLKPKLKASLKLKKAYRESEIQRNLPMFSFLKMDVKYGNEFASLCRLLSDISYVDQMHLSKELVWTLFKKKVA